MSCDQCDINYCIMCNENPDTEHFHMAARDMICTKTYKAGETIFRKNEPSTYLYILKSGRIKLTSAMPDGREQIIGMITPSHMLGVDALNDEHYPYSATAMGRTTVCRFRHNGVFDTLKEHPSLTVRVVNDLNAKLAQTRGLIEVMGRKTAIEKIAACFLSMQSEDESDFEESAIQLSRKELAEMLGLTEETISRVISELRRAGIIEAPRGKIIIQNRERLQDIADENPASPSKSSTYSAA